MITAVAQVTHVSTVTTSLHRLGELTVVHDACHPTTQEEKEEEKKG
jgi:hypothetical protein